MKYFLTGAALLAATVNAANKRDLCSEGSTDDDGNYYCQKVTGISYTDVGGSGTYDQITYMDSDDGSCSSDSYSYSGSLAPFDEEVRGGVTSRLSASLHEPGDRAFPALPNINMSTT